MTIVRLDMEGVLVPEIWFAFAERMERPGFKRATYDEFSMRPWRLWENEQTDNLCAI